MRSVCLQNHLLGQIGRVERGEFFPPCSVFHGSEKLSTPALDDLESSVVRGGRDSTLTQAVLRTWAGGGSQMLDVTKESRGHLPGPLSGPASSTEVH